MFFLVNVSFVLLNRIYFSLEVTNKDKNQFKSILEIQIKANQRKLKESENDLNK